MRSNGAISVCSQNPVKVMGRPSSSNISEAQSPPGQAASDVTSQEPGRLSPNAIDQTHYVKTGTNGVQNHTNWIHSQNNQDVRSKPTRNNAFPTNRPNNITPLGSYYRAHPPSSPGRPAQEWRDTPPGYSDLVARINRMEELQHSRLLTVDKVLYAFEYCVLLSVCRSSGLQLYVYVARCSLRDYKEWWCLCVVYICACVGAWPLICDVVLDYNEIPMLPIACVCMCVVRKHGGLSGTQLIAYANGVCVYICITESQQLWSKCKRL